MSDRQGHHEIEHTGLHQLPLRSRPDARHHAAIDDQIATPKPSRVQHKRLPESLHLTPSAFRLRSPTESSMSSISSANFPDSATTRSVSTVASPISTSYASEVQDLFAAHTLDGSRPSSRVFHRHKTSSATCSTFVNDEDDGPVITGYPDISPKLRDFHSVTPEPQVRLYTARVSPSSEALVKEEEALTPCEEHGEPVPEKPGDDNSLQKWETSSTVSDEFSPEDTDRVLDYVLQVAYGMDLHDASVSSAVPRQLVYRFIQEVGQLIWHAPSNPQSTNVMSTSSSSSTPSQRGGSGEDSQRGGKRKKLGRNEEEGDGYSDGEGSGYLPVKRPRPNPKEDDNIRLSCPFRKRNPRRFNVRDHHSCAMTYFPKFAELRQHIVKQHKRDDPSAFVCDRCNRDFLTRKELRDHQRLPKEQMCDISDHDPESGIDGPTSNKLLSRKRASGTSPEVQWKEIWNILFPDDDDGLVQPYHFTPVIEHFELSNHFLASFNALQTSLRDKISNPATLETLATKFHQCFVETMERCIADSQTMPYTNRSNKKNEPARTQSAQALVPRKGRDVLPRPDSGVVMDDGSEESGSIIGPGLTHKDSVRTVRGAARRGSNQIPETVREVLPANAPPGSFDDAVMRQLSTTPLGMGAGPVDPNLISVQAWNNGVLYPPGDTGMVLGDHLTANDQLTPHTEFAQWGESFYQVNYGTLNDEFTSFHPR